MTPLSQKHRSHGPYSDHNRPEDRIGYVLIIFLLFLAPRLHSGHSCQASQSRESHTSASRRLPSSCCSLGRSRRRRTHGAHGAHGAHRTHGAHGAHRTHGTCLAQSPHAAHSGRSTRSIRCLRGFCRSLNKAAGTKLCSQHTLEQFTQDLAFRILRQTRLNELRGVAQLLLLDELLSQAVDGFLVTT